MDINSFEQCKGIILDCIEQRKNVNYGDKSSVRKYNLAYKQMKSSAEYISTFHRERISDFLELVYHPDPQTSFSCACLLIQWIDCSKDQKRKAIDAIKELVHNGKVDNVTKFALCNGVLDQWEADYCCDSE